MFACSTSSSEQRIEKYCFETNKVESRGGACTVYVWRLYVGVEYKRGRGVLNVGGEDGDVAICCVKRPTRLLAVVYSFHSRKLKVEQSSDEGKINWDLLWWM